MAQPKTGAAPKRGTTAPSPSTPAVDPPRLVETKVRVTRGTHERVQAFMEERGMADKAEAYRSLVNAGLRALMPTTPAAAATEAAEPMRKAA